MPDYQWIFIRLGKEYGCSPADVRETWTLYDILDTLEVMELDRAGEQIAEEEARKK